MLGLSGKGSTGECAVACGSCVSGVRDVEDDTCTGSDSVVVALVGT